MQRLCLTGRAGQFFRYAKLRGSVAVEMALVLPLFTLMLFGMVEIGVAMYNKTVLVNAARTSARSAIVLRTGTNPDFKQLAVDYGDSYLIKLGGSAILSSNVTIVSDASSVSVSIQYDYTGLGTASLLSGLAGFFGVTFASSYPLNGTSKMMKEISF